jgi:DNA mismatch repair protein MSH5
MTELDERYGDMWTSICGMLFKGMNIPELQTKNFVEKEIEIIHDLAQRILKYSPFLTAVSDMCGELDACVVSHLQSCVQLTLVHSSLALAQGARQYRLVRPSMTKNNIVRIQGGRLVCFVFDLSICLKDQTYLARAYS